MSDETEPSSECPGRKISKPTFLAASQLKNRGWTGDLIREFLGEPDEIRPNLSRRKGRMKHLYSFTRVETAEASEAFKLAQEKRAKRGRDKP